MTFNEKEYMKKYLKEYRQKNRERLNQLTNRWKRAHPESRVEEIKRNNSKRMKFKGKIIHLKDNPRIGVCNLCRYVGITHMHHIKYHDDDPLKDTMELCASCHRKQHEMIELVWY